jgi:hypothetical protein
MTTKHGKDDAPIIEPPDPQTPPVQVQVVPKTREEVGPVHFEDASGNDNGWAHYHVPAALRERTLLWRHMVHEQNHQLGNGTWVYRLTHTSAVGPEEKDPNLEAIEVPSDAEPNDA